MSATARRLARSSGTRALLVLVILLLALGAGAAALAAFAMPAGAAPNQPAVPWSPCYKDVTAITGVTYECALVNVPLDHDRPRGPVVQLAVVRVPASDPENKIGSIFLNPGGPGGSGVDFALILGPFVDLLWGTEVRQRFDIVGFDPRGIQRSTAIRCFGNMDQAMEVFPPVAFPLTEQEVDLFIAGDRLLASQCERRGNRISDHMSTANVARDMDILRQRVGDEQITFVGLSYGSYLGQTYANLFPDRVRALVLDGVLDPEAWANVEGQVPFSTRLRSDHGAQTTLERFFHLCEEAGPDACALAPDAEQRFADLADRLLDEPVTFIDPLSGETFLLTYQDLIALTLSALYNPAAYPELAALLAMLEMMVAPTDIGLQIERLREASGFVTKRGFPNYVNFAEGLAGVACADSNNPDDYDVWLQEGVAADEDFGYFGRIWTWLSSPCAQWPLADEDHYMGPFDALTANPVLLIGNLYDPATRYEGAVTARGLLPNSALLTVDVPGHTSLGISGCAAFLTGQYLLNPAVGAAPDGFFCPQEFNPFELPGGPFAEGAGFAPGLRTQAMEEVAFRPVR